MSLTPSHAETRDTDGLTLRLGAPAGVERTWTYVVAGRPLIADAPLPPLAPFAVAADRGAGVEREATRPPSGPETPIYRGPGWVGGRFTHVVCSRVGDAYIVRIVDLPALLIDRSGCRVLPDGVAPVAMTDTLVEALLGPGLILPLALSGTFSLHAGAVAREGRAVLFVGESGAGKSTIARALAAARGFTLLADDVLPAEIIATGLAALPHYPQLKLAAAAQHAVTSPARVPVGAIVVLAPEASGCGAVAIEPVGAREAFLALSRHTVAARLFDAPLLAAHAAFCSAAVGAVAVHTLVFPRRLDALPVMVATLTAHFAAVAR